MAVIEAVESEVNLRIQRAFVLLFLISLLLFSACSPLAGAGSSSLVESGIATDAEGVVQEAADTDTLSPGDPAAQDMVAFRGTVFVATSSIVESLWRLADWRISDQPVDTDEEDLPVDCSLHPHAGVANQWVGSCAGEVLVPKAGAQHIAVMLTDENGQVTMIQVAPDPGNSGP
ncbi:MAG TPA: hypothetical protein VE136_12075 [Anaerolineales bacterium]|jgi:hypothetical protein|nr:hypothetical protein [Anaerolineales bacterium]